MTAVFAFLYIPIMVLIVFSFNQSKQNAVWRGFTFDWYVKLMSNDEVLRALGNTLEIACIATIIATVVGTLAAVGMYKYAFKGKNVLDNLLYIPVVIPEIVLGIGLLILFDRTNIELGLWTLILAHATFSIPFVVITVKSRIAGFDKSLEEAAMDLGASQLKTFIYITLPNILPGVISGALLTFTLSVDDVIISSFVNGPVQTLPIYIFAQVKRGVSPEINALSTLLLLATVVIAFSSEKLKAKTSKSTF